MLFRAAEIAYMTYMFAQIKDKDQYQIATSILRTSVMIGKFCCGILAQVLISYDILSYQYLLYLSILGKYLCLYNLKSLNKIITVDFISILINRLKLGQCFCNYSYLL